MKNRERDLFYAGLASLFHTATKEGVLFDFPEGDLDTHECAAVFLILKHLGEALLQPRMAELRERLLAAAQTEGESTKGGGQKLLMEGNVIIREKRAFKRPEEDKVKALLREKGLALTEAFNEVKTLELDAGKIDSLVDTGKLRQEDVQACFKVPSYALKVLPSPHMTAVLKELELTAHPQATSTLVEERNAQRERRRRAHQEKEVRDVG